MIDILEYHGHVMGPIGTLVWLRGYAVVFCQPSEYSLFLQLRGDVHQAMPPGGLEDIYIYIYIYIAS